MRSIFCKPNLLAIITLALAFNSCGLINYFKFSKKVGKPTLKNTNFKEKIPFQGNTFVLLKAKVSDSISGCFILDTGSPCLLDSAIADKLTFKQKKLGLGGMKIYYGMTDLSIRNLKYQDIAFLIMPLYLSNIQFYEKPTFEKEGKELGLIGSNAFIGTSCHFSFDDSTLTVSDQALAPPASPKGHRIPFNPHSSQTTPVVKLVVNNEDTITAFIDTGNPGFIDLNVRFACSATRDTSLGDLKVFKNNLNLFFEDKVKDSIYTYDYIRLKSLKIGELELNDIVVERSSDAYRQNLIGMDFLRHFNFTIDWINNEIFLYPRGKGKLKDSNINSHGIDFIYKNGKLKVYGILHDSEAESLGLELGSEIEAINGNSIAELDSAFIQKLYYEALEEDSILLKVKGEGQPILLKRKPLFP